ncbi:MAG: GTPase HflX [bacterium]|nr:GTPase HflX [bacterium]
MAKNNKDLKSTEKQKEKVVLVGTIRPGVLRESVEETMEELENLSRSAGAEVYSSVFQGLKRPDPAYFIGKGKAGEIARMIDGTGVDTIIFDDELSPAQTRNLERITDRKIVDRTGLILEIFAQNARTKEAKTQVELARLQYFLPRLTRQWTHLERQIGGIGVRGGMGETQLEVDRRLVRTRIKKLKEDLELIEKQRSERRARRKKIFKTTLVGYTNAGKSSLFNAAADAGVLVEDRLFATLDSTVRRIDLNGKNTILMADTVGFIRKLPHSLVASFRSTLRVVEEADLLIHVVDISNSDYEEQIEAVNRVLKELNVLETPMIHAFNKVDLVDDQSILDAAARFYPDGVFISAVRTIGIAGLFDKISEIVSENYIVKEFNILLTESKIISQLYEAGEVIEQDYDGNYTRMKVRLPKEEAHKIENLISD